MSGIPIDVPLPDPNACDQGVKCPVKTGDKNTFVLSFYVEPDFPTVSSVIHFIVKQQSWHILNLGQLSNKISIWYILYQLAWKRGISKKQCKNNVIEFSDIMKPT